MLRSPPQAAPHPFHKPSEQKCLPNILKDSFKRSRAGCSLKPPTSRLLSSNSYTHESLGCTAANDSPAKHHDANSMRFNGLKVFSARGAGKALLSRHNECVTLSWEQQQQRPRCFSTTSASRLRLWLAATQGPPSLWRQILSWGPTSSSGFLREVHLPSGGGRVKAVALGGWGVLAICNNRLLGVSLGLRNTLKGGRDASELMLEEIREEPPEAVGISQAELQRHLRRSEAEGIRLSFNSDASPPSHNTEQQEFVKAAAGLHHCAAITRQGLLYTWGRGGSWGAGSPLGHGDMKARLRPTLVSQFVESGEFVVDVACGAASTCVVTSLGRVLSSGAADYGLNGSGMLVSSKVFKELESFRGVLTPGIVEVQRRNEERQLQQLEAMKERLQQETETGVSSPPLVMRPFEASQAPLEHSPNNNLSDIKTRMHTASPKVACGLYHCALLTPEGALWLWGRNDCLQLGQEKIVMASGGESNYPILADFFTRSDVPLESCAMGPAHSLAVARNGMVYEWGGKEALSPHAVDLHWRYPESVFKSRVLKAICGGLKANSAFSAVLTEEGDVFFWGPGASSLPLALNITNENIPSRVDLTLFGGKSAKEERETNGIKVVDLEGGPQGCLLVTSHKHPT